MSERSVRGLLLDVAYGSPEHRSELEALRARIGVVVEAQRLPGLVAEAFPIVGEHAEFSTSQSECIATIAEMFGLEWWGGDWLVGASAETRLRDVRRVLIYEGRDEAIADLGVLGPALTNFEPLIAELRRRFPDLRNEASHRQLVSRLNPDRREPTQTVRIANRPSRAFGGVSAQPPSQTRKASARAAQPEVVPQKSTRPSAKKGPDFARRPAWWGRLREWSDDTGFELGYLERPLRARLKPYLEAAEQLFTSDDALHARHWWSSLRAPADQKLTDLRRIDAHSELLFRHVQSFVLPRRVDARRRQVRYEQLIAWAFLLGMADHVVDVGLHRRATWFSTFSLSKRLRLAVTVGHDLPLDEALQTHDEVFNHAAALGMSFGGVSRATDVLAVTRWDLRSRKVEKALRYRIPMVLIEDFLNAGMRDTLRAGIVPFPSGRASLCQRCGIIHVRDGRMTHRKISSCAACS